MADPAFEVRVDPAVHAAHPDAVAVVCRYPGPAEALVSRVPERQPPPRVSALVDLSIAVGVRVFDRLDGVTLDGLHAAAAELSASLLRHRPACHLDRLERHTT